MAKLSNMVLKYRQYTRWLKSLPKAEEVDDRLIGRFLQPIFEIEDTEGQFVIGCTGDETAQSEIASLPQGALLKARVFEPIK